jgi:uncharacterized protein YciI
MRSAALLLAAALLAAPAAASDLWWVFLTKGPHRAEIDPELLQQQQAEHVGNLGRLWNAGVAHLAGPLGDDGFLRGIVIMRAGSRDELMGHFEPDPFVRSGRLAVEAMRWSGSLERLGKPSEPPGMQQSTLVVVRNGPSWIAGSRLDPELLGRLAADGGLVLWGDLEDGGDKQAVLLFRQPDAATVEASLAADPAVATGRLVVETHPQYVGSGMLGEDPAPPPAQ